VVGALLAIVGAMLISTADKSIMVRQPYTCDTNQTSSTTLEVSWHDAILWPKLYKCTLIGFNTLTIFSLPGPFVGHQSNGSTGILLFRVGGFLHHNEGFQRERRLHPNPIRRIPYGDFLPKFVPSFSLAR